MDIKTKFEPLSEVYYMANNKVESSTVDKLSIVVHTNSYGVSSVEENYTLVNKVNLPVRKLFATKQDLLDSL